METYEARETKSTIPQKYLISVCIRASRKVSSEVARRIKMEIMPGFKLKWYYSGNVKHYPGYFLHGDQYPKTMEFIR